jgi:molybdate transport system substrate-binding protein
MAQAVHQGLISRDSIFNVAANQLIVVGRDDLSYSVTDLDGIAGSNVRLVAIGNPDSVPAGRYARAALEEGGLWERVSPHLIFTQNVRQCLDYVARGEVDLAFVYSTDVLVPRENVNHLLTINLSEPIVYPIGVLNSSNHPEESYRFIAFLKAEKAQEIIEINGFRNFLDLPR